MQSSGGGSSRARVRYYRPASEESEEEADRQDSAEEAGSEDEAAAVAQAAAAISPAAAAASTAAIRSAAGSSSSNTKNNPLASAAASLRDNPVLLAGVAAGVAATGGLLLLLSALGSRRGQDKADDAASQGKASSRAASSTGPGPNSKVKPSPSCVALSDGSSVVVHRPIAADNSCLFNAVGYCMHHSTNRAPYLRQVVSREVSSDPQHYSAAFLGMENAAYCSWIINPAHWGGGIELAILASHYRREIAAWNLATGACHVFGEDAGYTKRVMVIYNGVHYDALAVSPGPKAAQEGDATEFNPRTRRGKMIIAAAQKLVQLHRRGKEGHDEKLDKQKQLERQQRKQKKQSKQQQQQQGEQSEAADGSSSKEQPTENRHARAAVSAAAPLGPVDSSSSDGSQQKPLGCKSCGEQLAGFDAAKAHAAATGHVEFVEV